MNDRLRIRKANGRPDKKGRYVLLWLQSSPRIECNHTLSFAIRKADRLGLPVLSLFCLDPSYPDANQRSIRFLIEGLQDLQPVLEVYGIPLLIRTGSPPVEVASLAADAACIVTDRVYLRHLMGWHREILRAVTCPVFLVESNVVVPAGLVSSKQEWSAATFRRKIVPLVHDLLSLPEKDSPSNRWHGDLPGEIAGDDLGAVEAALDIDRSIAPSRIPGGEHEALIRLGFFVQQRLHRYAAARNDPSAGLVSGLSPFLHFGHISPVTAARAVQDAGPSDSTAAFLEQLIVRRELAVNYVIFNRDYDSFEGLPVWARRTLLSHGRDRREYIYSPREFEEARTHDPAWNAAQKEMVATGVMHGYMRMYWGKKILEWSETPQEAFRIAMYLNNRYELDGRDPNGYAGVAWCFGLHDRPFKERSVFGTVRYMSAAGLARKFNLERYITGTEVLFP